MGKLLRIKNELKELKQQRTDAERILAITKEGIGQKELEMAEYYREFFTGKRNTEFVYFDRYPTNEALKAYCEKISDEEHPLEEYGTINAKELAEIIKQLYQFRTGKEYSILTIGRTENYREPIYGDQKCRLIPHLYFLVGNDKSLESYQEYDGLYLNEDIVFEFMYKKPVQNLLAIEIKRAGYNDPSLDIECLTGSDSDLKGRINYYDYLKNSSRAVTFQLNENIFPSSLRARAYRYKGVKDTLDFSMHIDDSYIAKVLLSICTYKHNNGIKELTPEDYNHIFGVLFNEKVNIIEQAGIDIPKSLNYVPCPECRK